MGWCRSCGNPCGEREFCDEVCYETYESDMEEYRAIVAREEGRRLAGDVDDGPQNEWCGSKGNNT